MNVLQTQHLPGQALRQGSVLDLKSERVKESIEITRSNRYTAKMNNLALYVYVWFI